MEGVAISSSRSGERSRERTKVHLTRFADDFVCTGNTQTILEERVKPAIAEFLKERGLQFKDSKTQIVNIEDGFDFLGFTIQHKPWNYKLNRNKKGQLPPKTILIVKPRLQKVMGLKDSIRRIVVPNRPIESIIRDLNPILRGWSEYFRISFHFLPIFWSLGHYVWRRMWKWGRDRHPRRNAQWVFGKYVMKEGDRKWTFGKTLSYSVFDISTVTNWKLFPLKEGLNPYLSGNLEYFENRRKIRIEANLLRHELPYTVNMDIPVLIYKVDITINRCTMVSR